MAKAPQQQFKAKIHKQGPNPYVDVPARVSRAFSDYTLGGRISVEGELNGVQVRSTLIPVGNGGHRLYVNGGMRSAAGVGVGDTVGFDLRATEPELVNPPDDVATALRETEGAMAAFDALPPSHRRELLRYVDDARTPETRQRRVLKTVDHVLGTPSEEAPRPTDRPLWTCPKCGNQFVNKNQYHSCARYTVDELFEGKSDYIRELFDRFREIVEACGLVKVLPYRDMVGFMVRVRFAAAVPKTRWLDVAMWLQRRVDNDRFHKIETLSPNTHTHVLRITDIEQLDDQVAKWVCEAYEVGR